VSRIDELIAEHCPGGVEFKTLRELLGNIPRGKRLTKSSLAADGSIQVFHGGLDPIGFHDRANTPGKTVMIINTGASSGTVGWSEVAFWCSDGCFALPHSKAVQARYLYYYAVANQKFFVDRVRRAGIPTLAADAVLGMRIPIPPLEVQLEIVRVLDQFIQLEAELEAELEARRRQYDHYAGVLLAADSAVARVRFGDVAKIVRGASPRPIQAFVTEADDGMPWIRIADVPSGGKYITSTAQKVTAAGAAKSRRIRRGDFVLSNSMSFGRPYISQIDGYIHDGWLAISEFEDSFVPDYLYYLLRSAPIQAEFARRAGSGTVKNLNAEIVKSVTVPVPPRDRQERVVELLDRFDALVNDISVGLPAELAARREQYEYYRDMLFKFEEAVA
jgi:type I restriction enzyme S subunit